MSIGNAINVDPLASNEVTNLDHSCETPGKRFTVLASLPQKLRWAINEQRCDGSMCIWSQRSSILKQSFKWQKMLTLCRMPDGNTYFHS